jgi:ParB family chromosome partitioning protein
MAKKLTFGNNPLFSGPSLVDRTTSTIPYKEIALSAIERDTNQPRVQFDEARLAELSESIKQYGVLSPILVKPGKFPGKYQLISGERRYRASKAAGLATIPAIVDGSEDQTGQRTLSIQLVENLQRQDLTPLERAHAIEALKATHELTVRRVAEVLGISKSAVQRSLDLLNLPDDLLNALRQGAAESKVLLLSKIESSRERAELLKDIDSMTRTELEQAIQAKDVRVSSPKSGSKKIIRAEDSRLADELRRALGLKVSVSRNSDDTGKVVVDFYSEQDLQLIFRKLVAEL